MRRALPLLLCLLGTNALPADDYRYMPYKMLNTENNPFPYYIDSRSPSPGGAALGSAQQASDNAWEKWNAITCAAPKAVSRGLTGAAVPQPGDPANGKNVTPVFLQTTSDPDYNRVLGSPYVAGITVPLAYAGVLQNCNVFLNAANFQFSTSATPQPSLVDVESVVLHEAGHCLGLNHHGGLTTNADVMYQSIQAGESRRILSARDIGALCARYPVAGEIGASCYDGGTCEPGKTCFTQNMPGVAATYCTVGCNVSANEVCPLPLVCTATSSLPGSTGACMLPSGNVTPVGKACTGNTDCVSAVGICLRPETSPSNHNFWAAGYCTQTCEAGQPACPTGATCSTLSDGSHKCLASCRPGFADCRTDYACVLTTNGGVCAPQCYTNADCQDSQVDCRTCDGVCVAKQNPSAAIGDLCANDNQCGAGQSCLVVAPTGVASPQCTQQCGRGCGMCPTGSSCISTTKGLNCLKDCTGPNTCPLGLRCADFPAAKGCVPVCQQNTDCPVGQNCRAGECVNDVDDGGGCGVLCMRVDAGGPVVVPKKDAGDGNTTPDPPCGCETSSGSVMSVVGLWALVLLLRRLIWAQ